MRSLLFVAMLLPLFVTSQVNRSAREFASEQVKEYVTTKLFKGLPYKAVSFGELKTVKQKRETEIAWTIDHNFEITEQTFSADKTATPKACKFRFYLDDKMKIVRADSFGVN